MPENQEKDFDLSKYILGALVIILLSAIIGCCCFDIFNNSTVVRIINVIVMFLTSLITILAFFGIGITISSKRARALLVTICVGVGIGALISILICDVAGLRLKIIPAEKPDASVQIDSTTVSSEAGESDESEHNEEPGKQNTDQSYWNKTSQADLTNSSSTLSEDDNHLQEDDTSPPVEATDYNNPISATDTIGKDESISYTIVEDFFHATNIESVDDSIPLSAKNKIAWGAAFEDKIRMLVGTESLPNSYGMNWNPEFSSKTAQANKIEEDIKNNGVDISKLSNLIALRKEAYEIYPTENLRYLLSNNYFQLARQHKVASQWKEAYDCYLESAKYEVLYIKTLPSHNDSYYIHLFALAVRFHAIGDISALNLESKIEALYLATCLFEATSKNNFSKVHEKYQSDSYYYAGMTNHKLVNLCWKTKHRDTYHYFEEACAYYLKSLDYLTDTKHKYTFLAQLYTWAQEYIQRYGRADGMLTLAEYKELADKYTDLGR